MKTLGFTFTPKMRKFYIRKPRKAILVVLSALLFTTLFSTALMNSSWATDLYLVYWMPLENVSCHYIDHDDDMLASADDLEFPARSVFFHETSCNGAGLDSRQACSVESAARAHPHWSINVLFTAPGTNETLGKSKKLLQELGNVKFYRIHLTKYAKGTPLEDFVAKGALNRTRWRISHTSDVLRYLTLFKWGGVYLDLDVVVAKPFNGLARNWAARESEDSVAAGAMAFSRDRVGRTMAEATIRFVSDNNIVYRKPTR
ncbi:unnamed protein product [Chilo suppressalis]|uniref:Alpha-1,4-N-acetylglucosaminyltransferase n=1 Tax=Chilo suppressalis TaxID=168631 RepID=A0ABN8L0W4_CHISP|nr:unnamed protein product [Chilo suppressalis]